MEAQGWKTKEGKDVVNRDIWEALDVVSERTRKHGKDSDIEWIAVPGHSGMPGNERCDEIAVDYSQGLDARAVSWAIGGLSHPPGRRCAGQAPSRNPSPPHPGAYYVSVVGGVTMRHKTWAECEARVKAPPARVQESGGRHGRSHGAGGWGRALPLGQVKTHETAPHCEDAQRMKSAFGQDHRADSFTITRMPIKD